MSRRRRFAVTEFDPVFCLYKPSWRLNFTFTVIMVLAVRWRFLVDQNGWRFVGKIVWLRSHTFLQKGLDAREFVAKLMMVLSPRLAWTRGWWSKATTAMLREGLY